MGSGHPDDNHYLIALARRRAFETYMRFGRRPDAGARPSERKAINPALAIPGIAPTHATSFYVWRTTGDDRVRDSHAANDGHVFSWAEPPSGGHPGTEPNCRCWAEAYYGDPSIPDVLQPLAHHQQVSTDGTTRWASIETLSRSDGSLAQSAIVNRDGTTIRSRFQATSVARTVALADGQVVHIRAESGLQGIYFGNDSLPLFQSRWTATGPKVVRTRQHLAFLLDRDQFNDAPAQTHPELILTGEGGGGGSGFALGAVTSAMTAIFVMLQDAPASQGMGARDEPVVAVKGWTVDGQTRPVPILVGSLTEEQLRQHCRFLPDVQGWTDDAAALLAEQKPVLPARTWGSLVHGAIKRTIDDLKKSIPFIYDNLRPEISFASNTMGTVPYGRMGSTRLDIVEDRSEDEGVLCDYDIKTGREGLTLSRLKEIADRLSKSYRGVTIYIIEVRPRP